MVALLIAVGALFIAVNSIDVCAFYSMMVLSYKS